MIYPCDQCDYKPKLKVNLNKRMDSVHGDGVTLINVMSGITRQHGREISKNI